MCNAAQNSNCFTGVNGAFRKVWKEALHQDQVL